LALKAEELVKIYKKRTVVENVSIGVDKGWDLTVPAKPQHFI